MLITTVLKPVYYMPKHVSWTHPSHARGVRSAWPTNERGPILSDRKIFQYALAGRYGDAERIKAETQLKKPKKKKPMTLAFVLKMLSGR